jgi:predicted nuclease of predicted toxin-antitoxin system
VKFLIDRCAGHRLAAWLRLQGHDVTESRERDPDPGDRALLEWAAAEGRVLVTIDTDFGELLFVEGVSHCGLVRLPDVPPNRRIELMAQVLKQYSQELEAAAIITVRGGRIRISRPMKT